MNTSNVTIAMTTQVSLVHGQQTVYVATYTAKSGRKISAIGLSQKNALRNLNRKSPIRK